MSASKYYSHLRVEADQKQVIIAHLKEQIYHLKKREQEFYNLEDQYRQLELKYRRLAEEKAICDSDFHNRHEGSLKAICSLRAELDDMKAEFRDKNLQINDLETDENTLRNQLDQRNIEIEKLKAELQSLLADSDELAVARAGLLDTSDKTRFANASLSDQIHELSLQHQDVGRKIGDTQKYLDQLMAQEQILKEKIISYENENNRLDQDINATVDDLAVLDNRILDSQTHIKDLQADIAEADALANKYKSEAVHCQKATQAQVMKNNDTTKLLAQAENTLRVRIQQVAQGRKEIAALTEQNENLSRGNHRAEDDLQFCQKHLQNLALINSEILMKLERFSEEDEEVRRLIDRRAQVQRCRSRVEQTSAFLTRTTVITTSADRSPFKRHY